MITRLSRLLLLAVAAGVSLHAQLTGWDTSGNGKLNGQYYFRHVIYQLSGSGNGTLSEAYSVYGGVSFSGTGTYSMNATLVDLGVGRTQQGTISGTYSIAASGQGFLSSPLFTGDSVFGLVGQQGIFVGSSTENTRGYHDLFIAAPLASPPPALSSFRGSYSLSYFDLSSGNPLSALGASGQMNPDGNGNLGSVPVTVYVGQNGSSKVTQTLTGGKFIFSNGAAVVTFPNSNNNLFSGQYYLYFAPDGNFFFGGSPVSADMIVGVRAATGTPALGGLYYEASIEEDESTLASGYANPDSLYGSWSAGSGNIIGHQRLSSFITSSTPYHYTYSDSYNVGANGSYNNTFTNFVVGAGGIRIASGIGPFLGLGVALPAPTISPSISSSGVFLNPAGVVNAGSSAPFTAGIAPGELLTIYGANMAPSAQIAGSIPFPTTLNKVQVKINNIAAPLYYVTPTQISAIVPYSVTSGVAQIQVINDGVASNTVTALVAVTAPGVLTQTQNGLGYGDVVHADGTLVNAKNPAKIGETVLVFLTGLGGVNPAIADGAAGPSDTLSNAVAKIGVVVGSKSATVGYAGLAPQLAGLYQINVTIPDGVTAGDNVLAISGPDAYTSVCLIAIAGATSEPAPENAAIRRRPVLTNPAIR
jgi:uncharacterized protein (TIGR03437 family)